MRAVKAEHACLDRNMPGWAVHACLVHDLPAAKAELDELSSLLVEKEKLAMERATSE